MFVEKEGFLSWNPLVGIPQLDDPIQKLWKGKVVETPSIGFKEI